MAAAASTGYGSLLSLPDKFVGKDFSLFAMRAAAVAEERGFLFLMQKTPEELGEFLQDVAKADAAKVHKLNRSLASFLILHLDNPILKSIAEQLPTAVEEHDGNAIWWWLKRKYPTSVHGQKQARPRC
jgi:hypothetical protein